MEQAAKSTQDPELKKALEQAIRRLKETPKKTKEIKLELALPARPQVVTELEVTYRENPAVHITNAEQALKKLRAQPNDKESLEALERAVKELKAATPAPPKKSN